jgi:uncharacterized RDD family membrane protein YckC
MVGSVIALLVAGSIAVAIEETAGESDTRDDAVFVIVCGVVGVVCTVGNSVLLALRGQSVGHIALSIGVVRLDGGKAEWWRLLFLRSLPLALAWVACFPLAMLSGVPLFFEDQRCVHDFIAGTKVIRR